MHTSATLLLHNTTRDLPVCSAITVANTPWLRLRGLLGRPQQQPGTGLLLLPSRGIHTFGMRHAIDAIALDSAFRVVRVCGSVPPWRIRLGCPATHCVLEMRSGEAHRVGLCVGDQLCFSHADGAAPNEADLLPSPLLHGNSRAGSFHGGLKLLVAVLLCVQALVCWNARTQSLSGQVDLRAYYSAGALMRSGGIARLYDDTAETETQQALFHDGSRTLHFLYPPVAALPYVALSLLPYRLAFVVAALVSLGCMFGSAWLLTRAHSEWTLAPGPLSLLCLAFFPSVIALMQGQISFVLLLVVTGCYCLDRRGQPLLAGLCLAMALVKLQVALPIALLYLLWKRTRVVAGFALGGAALLLASLLLVGTDGLRAYAHRLHSVGSTTLLDQHAAHLQYGMQIAAEPNLHGLATLLAGNGAGSALLTLVLSLTLLLWAARQRPSMTIAVPAALLLSYHLQPYDLVLLLLPFALTGMPLLRHSGVHGGERAPGSGWLLACGAAVLSAPVAPYLMLRNATVWYLLGSAAMLLAASVVAGAAPHARDMPEDAVLQGEPLLAH